MTPVKLHHPTATIYLALIVNLLNPYSKYFSLVVVIIGTPFLFCASFLSPEFYFLFLTVSYHKIYLEFYIWQNTSTLSSNWYLGPPSETGRTGYEPIFLCGNRWRNRIHTVIQMYRWQQLGTILPTSNNWGNIWQYLEKFWLLQLGAGSCYWYQVCIGAMVCMVLNIKQCTR